MPSSEAKIRKGFRRSLLEKIKDLVKKDQENEKSQPSRFSKVSK